MYKSLLAYLSLSSSIFAVQSANCDPGPTTTCYPDDCRRCYCLGPENIITNAPVCPMTCNGDWDLTLSGFYWTSHEGGLEYAIDSEAANVSQLQEGIINANFEAPNFKWDFGFKLGLGYCTTCDGWDFGATWTWFQGHASSHNERERSDQGVLIPIWTVMDVFSANEQAGDIKSNWQVEMNLIDIDLGRSFWTSKYLSIRPHVGLRICQLNQEYTIQYRFGFPGGNPNINNDVNMDNDFKGVGIRAGLDSTWNFGCGWALFGDFATSIVYGKFKFDHDETFRESQSPFQKEKKLESKNFFRSSRAMLDYTLGIQWTGMFCDCQYGLTLGLAWEQHIFFHQNQMWRGIRYNEIVNNISNNTNVLSQRQGTLDTHGFTLTVDFAF